jgi:hypothetical protein
MSQLGREINGTGMPEVAYRILFNVGTGQPIGMAPIFGAVMLRINALKVLWDLTVMSHGQGKSQQPAKAVEVVLYRDDEGNCQESKTAIIEFLKSHSTPYRLMSDVTD